MTVYFPYFTTVHISKLLYTIQMNYAIVSESMAGHVIYTHKDDKVAGSHLQLFHPVLSMSIES